MKLDGRKKKHGLSSPRREQALEQRRTPEIPLRKKRKDFQLPEEGKKKKKENERSAQKVI